MPARLQISSEEYLSTSFEGTDREYVHGEVVERSTPNYTHGRIQMEVAHRFRQLTRSHHLYPCTEVRMRVGPDLYLIPDVAVFAGRPPEQEVPEVPPMVAIKIVSPEDRLSAVIWKLEQYRQWGIAHIWVIDPVLRRFYVYHDQELSTVPVLNLPGYPVQLTSLFDAEPV